MNERGLLTVISGFSGSGKGTVMERLLAKYPDEFALSISATTRDPRPDEREGVDYFYKTRETFEEMIQNEQFLEYAEYVGNYYGTPREFVENNLEAGRNVLLEIEMQGALKVREKIPDTLMIFLTPPSVAELIRRLRGRGTESEEVIHKRVLQARKEAETIPAYDYIVINDDLETCVDQIYRTIEVKKTETARNGEFIGTLQSDLEDFLKGEKII